MVKPTIESFAIASATITWSDRPYLEVTTTMTTQTNCVLRLSLEPGSDTALAFALSQSATADVSGNNDNPSALVIRPTFSTSSTGYQASYAYIIKGVTTDQIDSRINLATPAWKWDAGCSGVSNFLVGSFTLD